MIFASVTPRDLNHDPKPWLYRSRTYTARYAFNSPGHVYARDAEFDPRPEFDHAQHNDPNPILLDYRMDIEHTTWRDRSPLEWLYEETNLDGVYASPFTDQEIDHAQKVLTRLAKLARMEP